MVNNDLLTFKEDELVSFYTVYSNDNWLGFEIMFYNTLFKIILPYLTFHYYLMSYIISTGVMNSDKGRWAERKGHNI